MSSENTAAALACELPAYQKLIAIIISEYADPEGFFQMNGPPIVRRCNMPAGVFTKEFRRMKKYIEDGHRYGSLRLRFDLLPQRS